MKSNINIRRNISFGKISFIVYILISFFIYEAHNIKVDTGIKSNINLKTSDKLKTKSSNNEKNNKSEIANSFENKNKQYINDPCPCASEMPACCTPEFELFNCGCIAKPICGSCSNDFISEYSAFHDSMLKLAMKDAYNQQDLAHKAKLQVELFQKAQDFAKEVGIQEMKAKQYARILNDATKKAQISRALMFQGASHVRMLADKTLRAITPMNCSGPRCGSVLGVTPQPAYGQYFNQARSAVVGINSKLEAMRNPVVSGMYGYIDGGNYASGGLTSTGETITAS